MTTREIKFRAWDNLTEKYIVVGFSVIGEVTMFDAIDQYCGENKGDRKTTLERLSDIDLEQFTGLHDKNGVEIYDGDIYSRSGNTYVIEMPNQWGGFYWHKIYDSWIKKKVYDRNQHSWLSKPDCMTCEVIGNIHQNPELL